MVAENNLDFTAYVGIDWADKKHDICIHLTNGDEREFSVLPHEVSLIDDWAKGLYKKLGSKLPSFKTIPAV